MMEILGYLVCFLLVSIPLFLICTPISLADVLILSACAYATQHFAHCVFALLYSVLQANWCYLSVFLTVYGLFYVLFAKKLLRRDQANVELLNQLCHRLKHHIADFISAEDVECVSTLPNPDQRLIDVKVYPRRQLLLIQVKNYYTGTLSFQDGLPVSTKTDRSY